MSEYVGCNDDLKDQPPLWFNAQPKHIRHPELRIHGVAEGFVLCDGLRYQWLDTGFGYPPALAFEKTRKTPSHP